MMHDVKMSRDPCVSNVLKQMHLSSHWINHKGLLVNFFYFLCYVHQDKLLTQKNQDKLLTQKNDVNHG